MLASSMWAINNEALADSLNRMCEWPSCVPAVKVKNIRRNGQTITVETNKVLAGKALTLRELCNWKRQVSYWVAGDSALNVRILSDGHELGDLVVSPIDTSSTIPSLEGKTIALWASHGRYYNETEERWSWQRALQYGTVEDRLTTEYTSRLVPMLEAAGARVLQPRHAVLHPGSARGRTTLAPLARAHAGHLQADPTPLQVMRPTRGRPRSAPSTRRRRTRRSRVGRATSR